jgi:hypothetical protein
MPTVTNKRANPPKSERIAVKMKGPEYCTASFITTQLYPQIKESAASEINAGAKLFLCTQGLPFNNAFNAGEDITHLRNSKRLSPLFAPA